MKYTKIDLLDVYFYVNIFIYFVILASTNFLVFGLGSSIAAYLGLNLPWSTLIQMALRGS